MLSACLALAVKSGRLSLLSQVIAVLFLEQGSTLCDVDVALLDDVRKHLNSSNSNSKTSAKNSGSNMESVESCMLGSLSRRSENGGIVLSFGKADHGKLGHGDTQMHRLVPTVIETLQEIPITKVVSMSTCVIAIDHRGDTYVWGTGAPPTLPCALK